MKQAILGAIICLVPALSVTAGSISVGKEVNYPTEFETRTQVVNGKVTVVTIPTSFGTRHTGTRMSPRFVGVSRLVKKDAWGKDVVLLRFEAGYEAQVRSGQVIEVEGVKYRAMGWRGKDYCLMDLKTRKIVKFRPYKA